MATVTYKSRKVLTASSNRKNYDFNFPYINRQYVKVQVNNNKLEYGRDYRVNNQEVIFTTAPTANSRIVIYRETPTNQVVRWTDSSILRATDMNIQQLQQLHINEENADTLFSVSFSKDPATNKWDADGVGISNVANPTQNKDVVNLETLNRVKADVIRSAEQLKQNTIQETNKVKTDMMADTRNLNNSHTETVQNVLRPLEERARRSAEASEASNVSSRGHANTAKSEADRAKREADRARSIVGGDYIQRSEYNNYKATTDRTLSTLNSNMVSASDFRQVKSTSEANAQALTTKASTQAITDANARIDSLLDQIRYVRGNMSEAVGAVLPNLITEASSITPNTDLRNKTNTEWSALGRKVMAVNQLNRFEHQPKQYGQLLNFPLGTTWPNDIVQLFIEHSGGTIWYRGGHSGRALKSTPFTKIGDTIVNSWVENSTDSANAWYEFSNGWVVQQGVVTLYSSTQQSVNLVVPMKSNNYGLTFSIINGGRPSDRDDNSEPYTLWVESTTKTNFMITKHFTLKDVKLAYRVEGWKA